MTLHIDLDPETEAKLQARANAEGKAVDAVVQEAVKAKLSSPLTESVDPNDLPYDEWLKRWRAFVDLPRPPITWFVDDSRESIYEGRGE